MEFSKIINNRSTTKNVLMAAVGGSMLLGGSMAFAADPNGNHDHGATSYTLQGDCAFLPAARATEFHGNAGKAGLRLGMAGNQWVVFEEALQAFNLYRGEDHTQPAYRTNDKNATWTLADLQVESNQIYTQLIPPGQIRKQIKSGCMTLGNDEDRNFLPGNIQVDFDVFASTNYKLMQDLANNGFIDEAVPYIQNRLDLMVAAGNPKGVGNTNYTGDTDFDTQFDIIMDLLSGDIIASSLDHINEGIHNASNGYMKKAHAYVKANDRNVTMVDGYTYADSTTASPNAEAANTTKLASVWIQNALNAVASPLPGSPGALRLVSGDAGENHSNADPAANPAVPETGHNLSENDCGVAGDYVFCEYAVLNKANTHESRVHHVETPNGIVNDPAYVSVDVGYVWITELAYQINAGNTAVTGMNGTTLSTLGIPNTDGVNGDKIYSLALLATSENENQGRSFINFLRSTGGQTAYIAGGFTGVANPEKGKCYAAPVAGVSVATNREAQPGGVCPDWLGNGSF